MSVIDVLSSAQGGRFFARAAEASGLAEADARLAISELAPAIAAKLKDKASRDPEAFDQLLDLLEEGGDSSDLNDADAMTGAEALSDGGAVLDDLYGSRPAALAAMGKLAPGVKGDGLEKISAISATSVLAVLASSNAATLASDGGAVGAASPPGGGIMSIIIAALVKGLMSGAMKSMGVRQRRRRRRYYYGSARRTTRRRRTRRPGLDDIFRSVLGGR